MIPYGVCFYLDGYDANDLSLSWSSHLIFDRWVEMTDFTRGPQWMGNCSERSTYIIGA